LLLLHGSCRLLLLLLWGMQAAHAAAGQACTSNQALHHLQQLCISCLLS
jgi:hypothetical protein